MDAYLTNGSRSVPKLICIDKSNNQEIGTWGARPSEIQKMAVNYEKENPEATHDEFVNNLHLWYAKDQTTAIQDDFIELLQLFNSMN